MKIPTIPLPEIPDSEGYDSENFRKYRPRNRLYRMHLERFHRDVVERIRLADPASILEVGCGEGFLLHVLREYGKLNGSAPDLAGVDVRTRALHYASGFVGGDLSLAAASAYDLPFETGTFDLVLCSQVLEHLRRPGEALSELCRVARRGVLVTVPREPLFRSLAAASTVLGIGGTPSHLNFWSARGFDRLLRAHLSKVETGTSSIYRIGIGWCPPKAMAARVTPRRGENAA